MFVRKKKLDEAESNVARATMMMMQYLAEYQRYKQKYQNLLKEWNELVERINKHGGDAIFHKARPNNQLDAAEIDKLINLCHPDKHNGKPMATEMTQKLLQLKKALK